jgi:hypothetical protein
MSIFQKSWNLPRIFQNRNGLVTASTAGLTTACAFYDIDRIFTIPRGETGDHFCLHPSGLVPYRKFSCFFFKKISCLKVLIPAVFPFTGVRVFEITDSQGNTNYTCDSEGHRFGEEVHDPKNNIMTRYADYNYNDNSRMNEATREAFFHFFLLLSPTINVFGSPDLENNLSGQS